MTDRPGLGLVVTGAPLTRRALDVAAELAGAGWDVHLIATAPALDWLDEPACAAAGFPVTTGSERRRGEPRRPRPAAVVVCPATFNTLNKWAAGISDTYPLGVLNEALGAGRPACVVPFVNESLWGHPALAGSLDALAKAGVIFIDPGSGEQCARSLAHGTGDRVTADFDPRWIAAAVAPFAG